MRIIDVTTAVLPPVAGASQASPFSELHLSELLRTKQRVDVRTLRSIQHHGHRRLRSNRHAVIHNPYVGALQYSTSEGPCKPAINCFSGLGSSGVSLSSLVASQSTRMYSTSNREWTSGRDANVVRRTATNRRVCQTSGYFSSPFHPVPSQTLPPWTKSSAFFGNFRHAPAAPLHPPSPPPPPQDWSNAHLLTVQQLRTRIDGVRADDECSICLSRLVPQIERSCPPPTATPEFRELPCGHIFHRKCVDRWILSGSSEEDESVRDACRRCPTCRLPIWRVGEDSTGKGAQIDNDHGLGSVEDVDDYDDYEYDHKGRWPTTGHGETESAACSGTACNAACNQHWEDAEEEEEEEYDDYRYDHDGRAPSAVVAAVDVAVQRDPPLVCCCGGIPDWAFHLAGAALMMADAPQASPLAACGAI